MRIGITERGDAGLEGYRRIIGTLARVLWHPSPFIVPFIYSPDPNGRVRAKKMFQDTEEMCPVFFFLSFPV